MSDTRYKISEKTIQDWHIDNRKIISEHYDVCAHFGCGKKLSLVESLAGNKCIVHVGEKKVDVMKVLKFK